MPRTLIFSLFLVGLALSGPTADAQSRYSNWSNPDGGAGGAGTGLIQDLQKLIDEAEKARAADPVFLRDLRALIARHGNAWPNEAIRDDFRDGDFTHNPAWSVESGKYWIEKGYGLRSAVTPDTAATASGERKVSNEEVAAVVIGSILNRALGGKTQKTPSSPAAAAPAAARAYTAATVSNAFSLTAEITSWKQEGAFAIGLYQGARSSGYQLVYHPGQRRALELVRYSTRGSSVLEGYDQPLNLEDQHAHVIEWTRTVTGEMSISIDGTERIRATDRSFRDAFAGVMVENRGGDYVLARISVFGK